MLNSLLATMDASQKHWDRAKANEAAMISIPMPTIQVPGRVGYLPGAGILKDIESSPAPQDLKGLESQGDELD
jgi:hypothetical protein